MPPPSPNIKKYFGSKKIGPTTCGESVDLQEKPYQAVQILPRKLDLALRVMKLGDTSEKVYPGWTGCNTWLTTEVQGVSNITYLPIIDASPTEYDTVYTILERSLQYADSQDQVVVVFDQAIYAKA